MTRALTVDLAWGVAGAYALAADVDVVVIVDVLSFTTAVSVATACGAMVRPVDIDEPVTDLAPGDLLAGPRDGPGPTLSPVSLRELRPGQRLLLPSLNGAAISRALGDAVGVAAAFRNAGAVVDWLQTRGGSVGIVAAGEREDDGWRPSYEDAVGAGAIAARLSDRSARCSPQASAAAVAFRAAESSLAQHLRDCRSGNELVSAGFAADVDAAAELDADHVVPVLRDHVFVAES
jgi:2-phosphosulfolactate phosphatase